MSLYFLAILALLALIDARYHRLPNIAVIPAIIVSIFATGFWLQAIVMFCLAAYVYRQGLWRGGDVKLFCLIGATFGFLGILILPLTIVLIYSYRVFRDYNLALPVAPFVLIATVATTGTIRLLQSAGMLIP